MFNHFHAKLIFVSALLAAITSCSTSKKVVEQSELNQLQHQSAGAVSSSLQSCDFSASLLTAELRADSVVISRTDSLQIVIYQPTLNRHIDKPTLSVATAQCDSISSQANLTVRQSANSAAECKSNLSITSPLKLILAITILFGLIKIFRKLFN